MEATTHYGEFKNRTADEGSDRANKINRLICQLKHPSMAGRSTNASTYLRELLGPEALPET